MDIQEPDAIDQLLSDVPHLLKKPEVAKLIGVSEMQISRWVKRGTLKALKLTPGIKSGCVRFSRDDIASFLRAGR